LEEASCKAVLLLTSDKTQHLLLRTPGTELQLSVSGASLLKGVNLMADVIRDIGEIKPHLRAQMLFCEIQTPDPTLSERAICHSHAQRLGIVLQAVDGFHAGASLREIGSALFGADRVNADWDDDRRHLKDRTRRAVARGRWLVEGGYRKLLK
jgi:hypothetical protein